MALAANPFTRTGYTYQGWATTAAGGVVYSDGETGGNLTAVANGTVNLYAVWQANAYTVITLYAKWADAGMWTRRPAMT